MIINNISRFFYPDDKNEIYFCRNCCNKMYSDKKFKDHLQFCKTNKAQILIPSQNKYLQFKNLQNTIQHNFICYVDIESYMIHNEKNIYEHNHLLSGYYLHCIGGDCKSFNLIYCAQCTRCNKAYIGKTTQPLGKRVTQHRNPIATISSSLEIDDTNTLAAHCIEHNTRTKTGFNSLYKFFVIKYVEREKLVISEQFFINKYFTYKPYGLNVSNPIGLTNHFNTNL